MSNSAPIHIAIVDDDDDASLCRSLGRFLRASGMQPSAYASAEAFLADDRRPQFDCLVLETRASGKAAGCAAYFRKSESGAEVLKAIRGTAG